MKLSKKDLKAAAKEFAQSAMGPAYKTDKAARKSLMADFKGAILDVVRNRKEQREKEATRETDSGVWRLAGIVNESKAANHEL